ncbi:hypothetical protein EV194_102244 [Natronoflexus pectinivorans]|uniref:Uncharacterized protein n=1 Tax=Natronoflexus pectinivorans TaxID=682526 RepID=A0A4R2GLF8_9BACT|nr:hypothetical protein EV194_102244 [Natronoflexus pectinivorans]
MNCPFYLTTEYKASKHENTIMLFSQQLYNLNRYFLVEMDDVVILQRYILSMILSHNIMQN